MLSERRGRPRGLGIGILWVSSLAAAAWGGRLFERASQPHTRADRTAEKARKDGDGARSQVPVFVPSASAGVDAFEIRRIVREELADRLDSCRGATEAKPSENQPDPVPTTAEAQARAGEASQLVERAVASGQWTTDDRERFADLTADLPPPTVIELQRKLFVAINRGQVVPADHLHPFARTGRAQ